MLVLPLGTSAIAPRSFHSLARHAPMLGDEIGGDAELGVEVCWEVMRRAFHVPEDGTPRTGDGGDPTDVALEEVAEAALQYTPVKASRPGRQPPGGRRGGAGIVQAGQAVIHAGQGVLYAEATDKLLELAELLQRPVLSRRGGQERLS